MFGSIIIFTFDILIFIFKEKENLRLSDSTTPVIGLNPGRGKFGGAIVIKFIPGGVFNVSGK